MEPADDTIMICCGSKLFNEVLLEDFEEMGHTPKTNTFAF